MTPSQVFDVSEETFDKEVLQRSAEVPVVVDFWADWCAPCRTLGPLLERLAVEANGSWVLAKLDVDSNQSIAGQFGIRGIPAVKAFRDGREVAEFVGALPEPQVRRWLTTIGPTDADRSYEDGAKAERAGDLDAAAAAYRKALDSQPDHGPARAALERIELAQRAASVDAGALRRRLEADPTDVDAAIGLADLAAAAGRIDEAASLLLNAVRATTGEKRDAARLHLLRLLDTLPADHPVALKARRDLSLALF